MMNIATPYETPCYCICEKQLEENINSFYSAFLNCWGENIAIGYSIKTNHFKWLLQYAISNDLFAEAVSADEYDYAINCGFCTSHIILNGPVKNYRIIEASLAGGGIVNLESFSDIDKVAQYIDEHGLKNSEKRELKIGIRINFDLETECPGETTAGRSISRFGFCFENGDVERAIRRLHKLGVIIHGFHLHYSTLTRSARVFSALAKKACELARLYHVEDEITFIDIGGGFWGGRASEVHPSPEEYAKIVSSILADRFNPIKVRLILEPGASVLATAVDYRCKVVDVRNIRGIRVITTDGTTLHINPLQQGKRSLVYTMVRTKKSDKPCRQIICGNTCMENDRFFETDSEPALSVGDEIVFHYAGAYTMAFNCSFINVPPNIYLENRYGNITCVRKRTLHMMTEG